MSFEKDHTAEMHPGPAPLTDTECAAIAARSVFDVTTTKHPTSLRRRVEDHRERTMDPLGIACRGRGRPVRRVHRPAPEPEPGRLDRLGRPQPRSAHLDHHLIPTHPSSLLTELAETLTHQTGTRRTPPTPRARTTSLVTSLPTTPGAATTNVVGNSRWPLVPERRASRRGTRQ